ncbi:DUF7546 family protein [Halorussus marinus]|uniref:DUF7546 family protein n=1 Tax=Halorussus marinus TaxID=2505976 RepID=UPI00106E74B9|nr:hypothetical protein [Halorussus marinus]
MSRTLDLDLAGLTPDRDALLWAGLVVNTEIILTAAYLLVADVTVTEWRYLVYPFVWINLSALAVGRTDLVAESSRARYVGAAIGAGYLLVLASVGGLVSPGVGVDHALGWRVAWLPPGWGPALVYSGTAVQLTLMPYKVVGYLTLAYLVYASVLDAAGSAVSGLLGLVSCVSCTWPVLASVAGAVAGSGTAVAAAASEWSYLLGTVAFAVTVGLLVWRPTVGR